ncbi:unnamed protein product [Vitrella brassicaformis CCMP3155]|uniref:Transmembrane protein n=1 Tax=Vitrella brassicaformis (strain CCMP3155) TaxID=1169540 RepID=A0A0G4F5C7_VITBC|nr:unnamed protein product [Vitrella brassicaformis CCMP3155]|eukprot:CEM07679.1 unnamed protein product [Vitrella brassicaformis CCMP3155]
MALKEDLAFVQRKRDLVRFFLLPVDRLWTSLIEEAPTSAVSSAPPSVSGTPSRVLRDGMGNIITRRAQDSRKAPTHPSKPALAAGRPSIDVRRASLHLDAGFSAFLESYANDKEEERQEKEKDQSDKQSSQATSRSKSSQQTAREEEPAFFPRPASRGVDFQQPSPRDLGDIPEALQPSDVLLNILVLVLKVHQKISASMERRKTRMGGEEKTPTREGGIGGAAAKILSNWPDIEKDLCNRVSKSLNVEVLVSPINRIKDIDDERRQRDQGMTSRGIFVSMRTFVQQRAKTLSKMATKHYDKATDAGGETTKSSVAGRSETHKSILIKGDTTQRSATRTPARVSIASLSPKSPLLKRGKPYLTDTELQYVLQRAIMPVRVAISSSAAFLSLMLVLLPSVHPLWQCTSPQGRSLKTTAHQRWMTALFQTMCVLLLLWGGAQIGSTYDFDDDIAPALSFSRIVLALIDSCVAIVVTWFLNLTWRSVQEKKVTFGHFNDEAKRRVVKIWQRRAIFLLVVSLGAFILWHVVVLSPHDTYCRTGGWRSLCRGKKGGLYAVYSYGWVMVLGFLWVLEPLCRVCWLAWAMRTTLTRGRVTPYLASSVEFIETFVPQAGFAETSQSFCTWWESTFLLHALIAASQERHKEKEEVRRAASRRKYTFMRSATSRVSGFPSRTSSPKEGFARASTRMMVQYSLSLSSDESDEQEEEESESEGGSSSSSSSGEEESSHEAKKPAAPKLRKQRTRLDRVICIRDSPADGEEEEEEEDEGEGSGSEEPVPALPGAVAAAKADDRDTMTGRPEGAVDIADMARVDRSTTSSEVHPSAKTGEAPVAPPHTPQAADEEEGRGGEWMDHEAAIKPEAPAQQEEEEEEEEEGDEDAFTLEDFIKELRPKAV